MDKWKEGYLQASLRGVEFFIRSAENSGGRRVVSHQYPNRDDIDHEDLGRSARSFRMSAYIVGSDYFQDRENLIEALEAPGPARLVHPYRGVWVVQVMNFRQVESTEEGGMARFDIEMEEQRKVELTTQVANTATQAQQRKNQGLDALDQDFQDQYNLDLQTQPTLADARKTTEEGINIISQIRKVANGTTEFKTKIQQAVSNSTTLAIDAVKLSSTFRELLGFGTDPFGTILRVTGLNAFSQFLELLEISRKNILGSIDTGTPPSVYQDPEYPANRIQRLVQNQAIMLTVGVVPTLPIETVEQAEDVRKLIFTALDEILEDPTTSDAVYQAVRDAKSAVHEDLQSRILDLERIVDLVIPETRPSIKIVNEIYGELGKEQEFLDRNNIEHPGFVSGSVPLRVQINA